MRNNGKKVDFSLWAFFWACSCSMPIMRQRLIESRSKKLKKKKIKKKSWHTFRNLDFKLSTLKKRVKTTPKNFENIFFVIYEKNANRILFKKIFFINIESYKKFKKWRSRQKVEFYDRHRRSWFGSKNLKKFGYCFLEKYYRFP